VSSQSLISTTKKELVEKRAPAFSFGVIPAFKIDATESIREFVAASNTVVEKTDETEVSAKVAASPAQKNEQES